MDGMEREVKTFIGIDLHKDSLTWCARDSAGKEMGVGIIATKCRNSIVEFVGKWPRPVHLGFEAVGFYRWLWNLLEGKVEGLFLADATRLHAMKDPRLRVKTDFRDARHISQVLWREELPLSFVLGEPLYSLRQRLRHRHDLARKAARSKSSLKRICLRTNFPGPKHLTGARAVDYFDAFGNRLHNMDRERWIDLTDHILLLERQLSRVERDLKFQIESIPDILQDINRLCTAPGVGMLTAATVLTETGGLSRFNDPEQLACYSGLTTRVFQSADTIRHGHISKAGPPNLRWVLQEATWVSIRCNAYCRKVYSRIAKRAGSKKAATGLARRLLIWLWAMHTSKENWQKGMNDSIYIPSHKEIESLAEVVS